MTIQKQAFYEGAALHMLLRHSLHVTLGYDPPFFGADGRLSFYLKHSTKKRSPWGFTFTPEEQVALSQRSSNTKLWIGLVCGDDGVAAVEFQAYERIAARKATAIHIACYRRHREHYEVSGPDGTLNRKVSPSEWQCILER